MSRAIIKPKVWCKNIVKDSSSDSDKKSKEKVNETPNKDTKPQEEYVSLFKLPATDDERCYLFGDIEGQDNIFNSTIEIINKTINNVNTSYVFLGDIYDYAKPHESINMVKQILTLMDINIVQMFNKDTKEIDVIRAYRKLWKLKQLKSYSKYNIQYLHSKPKRTSINNPRCLFIMGNKEVIFVQEIITSERITKINDEFIVPADYKRKHKKPGQDDIKHTDYHFTTDEFNIMYTYITCCNNYAIIDSTLFIHCYINYKMFNDMKYIDRVISGHSKGYGKFIDDTFNDITIYIIDLTGIDYNVSNYMIMNSKTIVHDLNDNFKPVLDKLKYGSDIDYNVKLLDHHPLINKDMLSDDDKNSSGDMSSGRSGSDMSSTSSNDSSDLSSGRGSCGST